MIPFYYTKTRIEKHSQAGIVLGTARDQFGNILNECHILYWDELVTDHFIFGFKYKIERTTLRQWGHSIPTTTFL